MEWFSDTPWTECAEKTGILPTFPNSTKEILSVAKYNSRWVIILGFSFKIAFPALTAMAQPLPVFGTVTIERSGSP